MKSFFSPHYKYTHLTKSLVLNVLTCNRLFLIWRSSWKLFLPLCLQWGAGVWGGYLVRLEPRGGKCSCQGLMVGKEILGQCKSNDSMLLAEEHRTSLSLKESFHCLGWQNCRWFFCFAFTKLKKGRKVPEIQIVCTWVNTPFLTSPRRIEWLSGNHTCKTLVYQQWWLKKTCWPSLERNTSHPSHVFLLFSVRAPN